MVRFEFLDKKQFNKYSNKIFDILSNNMSKIAPTGNSRNDDFIIWKDAVSESIKKDNRHIVLIFQEVTNQIIGFFQYSTTIETFMMEEIQLCPEFQGRYNIFRDLYSFVLRNVSDNLLYVEAYANKQNHKSIGILKKLGLKIIGENTNGKSFYFRGNYQDLENWYMNHAVFIMDMLKDAEKDEMIF